MKKIIVRDVTKHFIRAEGSRLDVIGGLSFAVEEGEFVSILGPSGCGKSTLLNILAGIDHLSGGEILVGERPLLGGENGVKLGVVVQQPRLPKLRVSPPQ